MLLNLIQYCRVYWEAITRFVSFCLQLLVEQDQGALGCESIFRKVNGPSAVPAMNLKQRARERLIDAFGPLGAAKVQRSIRDCQIAMKSRSRGFVAERQKYKLRLDTISEESEKRT